MSGDNVLTQSYKLVDTSDGIVRIDKDNIDNIILCSSNMVSFLLTPYRFNPHFRENYL